MPVQAQENLHPSLANVYAVVPFTVKARKRQISVKNVPANVTEETVRSLFPEAQTISLKMESTSEGSKVG